MATTSNAQEESDSPGNVLVFGSTALARHLLLTYAKRKHAVFLLHTADAEESVIEDCLKRCLAAGAANALSYCCQGPVSKGLSDAFKYVHSKYHCVNTLLLTVGETFEGDIGEIHASEGSVKPLTQRLISRNYTALAMTLSEFLPSLKDANGRVGLVIPPHAFDGSGLGITAQYALEGYAKSLIARLGGESAKPSITIIYNGKHQNARVLTSGGELDEDAQAAKDENEQDAELAEFVFTNVLNRSPHAIMGDASVITRSGSLAVVKRGSDNKRSSMRASFQLPPACKTGDPEPPSADDAPPLLQAVLDQDKPRIKELLKGLKRSGGAGEQQNDDKGRNALHYAAHTGNAEIVMLLLRTKPVPDPKQRDDFHWTPLHYAARSGCAKAIRPLLKCGADPNALTNANKSPIHFLVRREYEPKSKEQQQLESALKDLINYGADVNQKDENHITPVFEVVYQGTVQTLQFLLSHEGDVNRRDRRGEIPLHQAVRSNKIEFCKLLLKYGSDPGAVGDDGSSFQLATSPEIMDLLEEFREVNRRDESEDMDKHREPIYINSLDDFPDNIRKVIATSKLEENPQLIKDNWVLFLWVLRFLMRQNYCPAEEMQVEVPKRWVGSKSELRDVGIEAAEEMLDNGNPRKLFKLVEECGRGGFGSVFLSKTLDKERVAIKRMPHVTDKQKWINVDEVYFLKNSVDCNNIVGYNAAYLMRDEIWISMEYLEGGTLQDGVARSKFTEGQIAYITKSILKGLKFIHSKNWIHRDLKADIWSLAILVLEMTNAEAPNRFSALRAMFLVGAGIVPEFKDPTKWSSEFHDFLGQMLKIDPAERPTAADLLKHPWIKTADDRKSMRNTLHELFIEKSLEDALGIGGL